LGPSATINGLDPRAPSAMAPLPNLLHVARRPISQTKWDDTGVHAITPPLGTMTHAPSNPYSRCQQKRHAQKPPWPLTRRPHNSLGGYTGSLDREPPIDERLGGAPPKPTNSLKLGRESLSGEPNEGPLLEFGALPATQPIAIEGRPQKASPRGSGPTTEAPRRAWHAG
jgi:hypothetical protein